MNVYKGILWRWSESPGYIEKTIANCKDCINLPERIGSNWLCKPVILLSLAQGGGRSLSTVSLDKINLRLYTRVKAELRAMRAQGRKVVDIGFWTGRADPMSTKGRKSKLTFTIRLTLTSKWTSWTESQLWKAYK